MFSSKKRIVVAMSGGVDSSTVAALLREEGHEVIGVTLQLYDHGALVGKKRACCAGQDIYDAQLAAETIGIPHYVLDYENIFKQAVIEDFVDSYLRGETPIPCVRCNQRVKFQDLFKVAKELGADALATGHYVQKILNNDSQKAELHMGIDVSKDQSYFLFATTKEQLNFLMFPIGGMYKSDTRALAKKYGLAIADKPDSQDICFVQEGGYSKIIEKLQPEAFKPGNIVFRGEHTIGQHNGIINYTIGQRRGINIGGFAEPLYVIKIDPDANQVVVGFKEDLNTTIFFVKELNWLDSEHLSSDGLKCMVKLRSSHQGAEAVVYSLGNNLAKVQLSEYSGVVSPGQACVIYNSTKVLGGGWIMRSSEL